LTEGGEPQGPAPTWDWNRVLTPRAVLLMLPVAALVIWAYWHPLARWEAVWRHQSGAWGHGYLIPVIAILIAHYRLQERAPQRMERCAWGLLFVLAGVVMRILWYMLNRGYPSEVTFVLVVAGVILWLLGWEIFRALWVSAAYLLLMIPWDPKYYEGVALPLQRLSAMATETMLWLVGMPVERADNVLNLASGPLTVAGACSGLHLLFAFVALGVMMAFIYRRPVWERLLIIGSSVPIAVFCNFVRVTLMAIASDAIFFQAQAVADGAPTWASYVPCFHSWEWWNWLGLLLVAAGLYSLVTGRRELPSRRSMMRWGGGVGMAVGLLVLARALSEGIGYTRAEDLVDLREQLLDPSSGLHQSFGFAMLGLAFLLLWAELKFIDLLFVSDETEGGGPDSPKLQQEAATAAASP
jgi:exosortase